MIIDRQNYVDIFTTNQNHINYIYKKKFFFSYKYYHHMLKKITYIYVNK